MEHVIFTVTRMATAKNLLRLRRKQVTRVILRGDSDVKVGLSFLFLV